MRQSWPPSYNRTANNQYDGQFYYQFQDFHWNNTNYQSTESSLSHEATKADLHQYSAVQSYVVEKLLKLDGDVRCCCRQLSQLRIYDQQAVNVILKNQALVQVYQYELNNAYVQQGLIPKEYERSHQSLNFRSELVSLKLKQLKGLTKEISEKFRILKQQQKGVIKTSNFIIRKDKSRRKLNRTSEKPKKDEVEVLLRSKSEKKQCQQLLNLMQIQKPLKLPTEFTKLKKSKKN